MIPTRNIFLLLRSHAMLRILVSVGLVSLWSAQSSLAQKAGSVQEDDIREAIVRYQIANWDLRADVYFVEIQSKDPTNEFLLRFADIPKPVEKKSASRIRKEASGNHVEEKHTKKRGVVLTRNPLLGSAILGLMSGADIIVQVCAWQVASIILSGGRITGLLRILGPRSWRQSSGWQGP